MLFPIALSWLVLSSPNSPSTAAKKVEYDATTISFGGSSLVVRSFKDCHEHFVGPSPDGEGATFRVLQGFGAKPMNVHLVVSVHRFEGHDLETALEISPISRTDSANTKCVSELATKTGTGVLTEALGGSSSGAITVKLDSGPTLRFTYLYGQDPTVNGETRGKGPQKWEGKRVQIRYKILQEGVDQTKLHLLDVTFVE
jgi:hypothetical protein